MTDVRRLVIKALGLTGLSGVQVGQLVNLSPATVSTEARAIEPEVDDSMPPDEPPLIEAPAPRPRPTRVDVSARFIAGLKRDYLQEGEGRSRRIGRLKDVQVWIEGLKPGQIAPRKDP